MNRSAWARKRFGRRNWTALMRLRRSARWKPPKERLGLAGTQPQKFEMRPVWGSKSFKDLRASPEISTPENPTLRNIFVLFAVDKDFDNLAVGILLRPQRGVAINTHGGGHIAVAHELPPNAYRSASFIKQ
jgi:hypothetical protein